jgi:hypothetical protein
MINKNVCVARHHVEIGLQCPQILAQLQEMLKLLVADAMTGVRTSISPLCVYMSF